MDRADAVVPLEDRVNYCFRGGLAGKALPSRSREMVDIVAYLAFISRGPAARAQEAGLGMAKMPALTGASVHGAAIFRSTCARCHGSDGAGVGPVPALWGQVPASI